MKDAEIDRHFPIKNLRHTAASLMAMRGVDLLAIGQILGHKDPKVTKRYAHLSPSYLRDAVERINPKRLRGDGA